MYLLSVSCKFPCCGTNKRNILSYLTLLSLHRLLQEKFCHTLPVFQQLLRAFPQGVHQVGCMLMELHTEGKKTFCMIMFYSSCGKPYSWNFKLFFHYQLQKLRHFISRAKSITQTYYLLYCAKSTRTRQPDNNFSLNSCRECLQLCKCARLSVVYHTQHHKDTIKIYFLDISLCIHSIYNLSCGQRVK